MYLSSPLSRKKSIKLFSDIRSLSYGNLVMKNILQAFPRGFFLELGSKSWNILDSMRSIG